MKTICFEDKFIESKGKPIEYDGKEIFLADYLYVADGDAFFAKIEECNSNWRQGIALKVYSGVIVIDGREFPKGVVVWQDSSITEFSFIVKSTKSNKVKKLEIKNVWDVGNGVTHSWHNGAAMWKEQLEDGSIRYWCNDGYPDDDLNDIVFRIQKIDNKNDIALIQKNNRRYSILRFLKNKVLKLR